jgi:hypothetical protein
MNQPFNSDLSSAATIANATGYHLSLSLEWLSGCQFSCKGCHVNKENGVPYTPTQVNHLARWLEDMRFKGGYTPTIVFLAPTDFLVADNIVKILTNIHAYGILAQFKRLSLQTTFLNMDQAETIAKILKLRYSHMELELNFIIEPEQVENEKYLDRIKENRAKMLELLDWKKHVASFAIMNVYEYDRVKKNNVKKILADYQALHQRIKEKFDSTIDFNFSMTRNSWWSGEDIKEAVQSVSRIFDAGVSHEINQTIRFSFGKLEDSAIEKHYNWHQGNLYVSPMIYERIASFDDRLKVPYGGVKATEDFELKLMIDQYHWSEKDVPCKGCNYQASCVDRNVLTFMKMNDIKECIIAKKALDAINVI